MITIAREPWLSLRDQMIPLWVEHHAYIADPEDIERVPLAPDWAKYDANDAKGALHIMVMRSDGEIVGYLFAIVDTHLHYRNTLCAFTDLYWIKRRFRRGWNGVRLFQETEKSLKARGVKKWFSGTKVWHDVSPIFRRLGWKETERLFTRWIGD